MRQYVILSPTGNKLMIQAESIYHSCNLAVKMENGIFLTSDYLKLNDGRK